MTIPGPKKLRLYDRLLNWLTPLSPEDVEYFNQERLSLIQHERVLKAEADRLELENRAKAAEVALVEEANQRERDKLNRMVVKGRAEFEFRTKMDKDWTDVTCSVTLSESELKRQIEFNTFRTDNRQLLDVRLIEPQEFLEVQPLYAMWITPWLQGSLEIADLEQMQPDKCFKRFFLVGNKKTG